MFGDAFRVADYEAAEVRFWDFSSSSTVGSCPVCVRTGLDKGSQAAGRSLASLLEK
jgi:hypothetical protein